MKTDNDQVRRALFTVTILVLLVSPIAHADSVYLVTGYGCPYSSKNLMRFDSTGNGAIVASGFDEPFGLALDTSGNLYVANQGNGAQGNGTIERVGSNGSRSVFASGLFCPGYLAFHNGTLYAGNKHSVIARYDSSGNVSTFAMGLSEPLGLAFDSSGNLYVGCNDETIRRFDTSGNGSIFASGLGDLPEGLAFDSSGNLYAAFNYGGTIRRFDTSGNMTTFASGLNHPYGIAFDSSGNLYVTTHITGLGGDGTIERFDLGGNGAVFASGLNIPAGIAVLSGSEAPVPEPITMLSVVLAVGSLGAYIRKHAKDRNTAGESPHAS